MTSRLDPMRVALFACALYPGLVVPAATARAATLTTLHAFSGFSADGMGTNPAGVVADAAGNLYGATYSGGVKYGFGVLFKLAPDGTETVLKEFGQQGDPSTLILDKFGVLYGTTAGNDDNGVVFKQPLGGMYRSVHPFEAADSGRSPYGGVIEDAGGNIYGTTIYGGIGRSEPFGGYGTIYKLSPAGQQTLLYDFTGGADGYAPDGGVVADAKGNLFGGASSGGAMDMGTIFKLAPSGKLRVLHSFMGGADGIYPYQPIMRDASGNLIGTTNNGGSGGGGIVFKLSPDGTETVLHAFGSGTDGTTPSSALVADQAGNLYGTTAAGGSYNKGIVFELSPAGVETILYEFMGKADGYLPNGKLVLAADGTIIGATLNGGTKDGGTIFKLTP
jgi:uncharacterized repeat protein (TIGR03803 family)